MISLENVKRIARETSPAFPDWTTDQMAENDLSLAAQGFEFAAGELDWYLSEPALSVENKRKIEAVKRVKKI